MENSMRTLPSGVSLWLMKMPSLTHIRTTLVFSFILFCSQNSWAATTGVGALQPKELEKLVEPIALYPDTLLSAILPAATFPDQIIDASLLIKTKEDAKLIANQSWDNSVKAIASYPGVLKMMFDKMPWTMDLGNAVLKQHREVLDAIQRLRGMAQAQGNLVSNEQQTVATETAPNGNTIITVQPADPEIVYVPTYSSDVVYQQPSSTSSALVPLASFGLGLALGAAMNDDDDDHYYYGGWGGSGYWANNNVDHWLDNRREVWEDYNDRKWDRQEFRQDMISNGNLPRSPEQRDQRRQEAQGRAQSWKQNNPEKSQQLASARSNRESLSDTSRGSFSRTGTQARTDTQAQAARSQAVSRQGSTQLYPKSSTNNPFQGYGSRTSTNTSSARGSYSRSTAGMGSMSRSGGFSGRSGGGGFSRGGGGRGGGRR